MQKIFRQIKDFKRTDARKEISQKKTIPFEEDAILVKKSLRKDFAGRKEKKESFLFELSRKSCCQVGAIFLGGGEKYLGIFGWFKVTARSFSDGIFLPNMGINVTIKAGKYLKMLRSVQTGQI